MILRAIFTLFITLLLASCSAVNKEEILRAKNANIPLLITKLQTSPPNSAGGIDVMANFVNTSSKTFKYVVLTVLPYNSVGDIAPSEIGNKTSISLKSTGPIASGDNNLGYWKNGWYNYSITCVDLVKISITYMDDTTTTISGSNLKKAFVNGLKSEC